MLDVKEALTTNCPSLSRISGLAPTSLPVIFSRMVVFPAFRRPMIRTRNRLHTALRSSDVSSMVGEVYEAEESSDDGADSEGTWRNRVGGSTFEQSLL